MRRGLATAVILLGGALVVAAANDVSATPAPRDTAAARSMLQVARIDKRPADFRIEIAEISAIQRRILTAAPVNKGIPHGQGRELTDVLRLGYGLCFDRSRAIETVLRTAGYDVRHASIYSTAEAGSALSALATPRVPSHAVSEVKTSRGWMIVDSNRDWLGLTTSGKPLDLEQLRETDRRLVIGRPTKIFNGPFTYVYGLYSRHGGFYPPYNPVPDVNWSELAQNIRV